MAPVTTDTCGYPNRKLLTYDNIEKYKYRLRLEFEFVLPGKPPKVAKANRIPYTWLRYDQNPPAVIIFKAGYCWNGSSGPTIDSKHCMRASLVHDGAYQLLRLGVFGDTGSALHSDARRYFDDVYRIICIRDGMAEWQANMRYRALRVFGGLSAN